MTEIEVVDTERMPDGTEYRAVIEHDEAGGNEEPYDDGQWPILRIDWSTGNWQYIAKEYNKAGEPYVEAFNRLTKHRGNGRNSEHFERYLRIFHGITRFVEYGPNQFTDYLYVAFDPAEWRDNMRVNLERLAKEKPLSEIEAWCEGDVWGQRLECRYNPDEDLDDEDGWVDVSVEGTTWGYYGKEWAEKCARDDLEVARDQHVVVHRYTEHEKLAKVEREVNAVLEFIHEGLDKDRERIPNSLVYSHWGVDYDKIKAERELMVKRLGESHSE